MRLIVDDRFINSFIFSQPEFNSYVASRRPIFPWKSTVINDKNWMVRAEPIITPWNKHVNGVVKASQ